MLLPALELAVLYLVLGTIDLFLSWQAVTRPIVICPLAGILLGDLATGCVLGASLESLFMGISAIGGSVPSDWVSTSFITSAYVILTGSSIDSAVAIAMPLGTAMTMVSVVPSVISAPAQALLTRLIEEHKVKAFEIGAFLVSFVGRLISTVVIFIAIYIGVEGLEAAVAAAPDWAMNGLSAVSSMTMAVGFAILVSQILTGETIIWFFVGYILVAYMAMDTLAVALLVAAAAISIFFIEKKIADSKLAASSAADDEEDFF